MLAAVPHASRETCFDNKRVLREAASAWIPPEVANRPKHRFNSSTLPLSKLVLTGGDEGLRDLLRPEEIERRGYFEPRQCEQLAAHNQFFALDHVFIIQLMDELFVSHFPTDSAARQSGAFSSVAAHRPSLSAAYRSAPVPTDT